MVGIVGVDVVIHASEGEVGVIVDVVMEEAFEDAV